MPDVNLNTLKLNFRYSPIWNTGELTANLSGGISAYGQGVSSNFDISAGINPTFDFPISAGIESLPVDGPVSPLAVHVGSGNILFSWSEPNSSIDHYELWVSETETGNYSLIGFDFKSNTGLLSNVPVGQSYFFKLRAVYPDDTTSSFVPVKKGKLSKPTAVMNVTGIVGSKIPKDSIFTQLDDRTGGLMAFKATEDITIEA